MKSEQLLDPADVLLAGGLGQMNHPARAIEPFEKLHGGDVTILFGMDKIILSGACEILVGGGAKGYFESSFRAGWPGLR